AAQIVALDEPATQVSQAVDGQPKLRPARPPQPPRAAEQIRTLLDQLADSNSQVRERAVEALMDLGAEDLPTLAKVVQACGPLRPSQRAALRDIVTHVFIASVPYEADPAGAGFLGLSWVPDEPDNPQEGGVPVARRLPGFIAYRMLREGDVIKGIARHGREEMVSTSTFAEMIKAIGADQTITFLVVRDGKLMRVPVRLSARPAGNGAMNLTVWLEAWIAENQRRADEYWQQHFVPLVGDDDDGVS
ncbi:MAG TPA: hypothetical protein VNL70_11240, partial [Tepidisphaeraceae bacterium]|nr:hypothetical protein [Tepidisphaeraceae bacterium]